MSVVAHAKKIGLGLGFIGLMSYFIVQKPELALPNSTIDLSDFTLSLKSTHKTPSTCLSNVEKQDYISAQIECLKKFSSDEEILHGVVALIKLGNYNVAEFYLKKIQLSSNENLQKKREAFSKIINTLKENEEASQALLGIENE